VQSNNIEPREKAKNYAFLLLKFRLRSEKELFQRLKRKKFEECVIKHTLSFLKDRGFIDDSIFAKAWILERIKKPLGLRRLKQELQIKGVDKGIIDNQIAQIKSSYSEEGVVSELAGRRMDKLRGVDKDKAKKRIYAYLLRRGFSPEVVMEAVKQL
jgi:regulatory protein